MERGRGGGNGDVNELLLLWYRWVGEWVGGWDVPVGYH